MMSLFMLLVANAYAPLAARGSLIDGLRWRSPVADAKPRSHAATCTPFPSELRHAAHARPAPWRDDRDSLAA